ncbi:MAG: dUTP diphosphatase [Holosporales bacterium]|jgi:dUTP pyrophosphatase|nr:dUTP diphosphatase [Holosporales bacterium]
MDIKFKKLNRKASLPIYGTIGSAGADLRACIESSIIIESGRVAIISTGVAIELPFGFFGMLCPRSGLASKNGITLLNSPGILDTDYRGEIKILMINHSDAPFTVEHGVRIAQLIIIPFEKGNWIKAKSLTGTLRAENGFGSTGTK